MMGLGPTEITLNFESDLDHHLDKRKIINDSGFSFLLTITCLGGGLCSQAALVLLSIEAKWWIMKVKTTLLLHNCFEHFITKSVSLHTKFSTRVNQFT